MGFVVSCTLHLSALMHPLLVLYPLPGGDLDVLEPEAVRTLYVTGAHRLRMVRLGEDLKELSAGTCHSEFAVSVIPFGKLMMYLQNF